MASASDPDQAHAVSKLRELFHLLDPEDSVLSKTDKDRVQEVRKMCEYFSQCTRRVTDYYRKSRPNRESFHNSIVPRFMQLLRESVLSHQWPEALRLTQALCNEHKSTASAVWKVGLACLYQGGERNSNLVEQFVKQVYILKKVAVVEVLLDYLLFLLKYSNIEDAKFLVQRLNQVTYYRTQLCNEKRKQALMLFSAYQGLVLYAEWKLAIFRAEQEENDTEYISQMLSQGNSGQSARTIADSAKEYLIKVKDVPGVWDIFVTRLVEMYEYYDEIEEGRSILVSYRERNCRNPNAHRYLYEFECSHDGEKTVQLECLQEIVRLDPCNPLCLKLYHLKEQDDPGAVSLLFDFLDYSHCSVHEEAWQLLADRLGRMDSFSPELKLKLEKCWKTRKDWWPGLVFRNPCSDDSASGTLQRNKRLVQEVMLNLESPPKNKKRKRDESDAESDTELKAKRKQT